jgi:hypothetical protein
MNTLRLGTGAAALALLLALSPAAGADQACSPATPRRSRDEPLVFPETNLVTCHQERTIAEDPAFFGGEFRSDTGHLTTRFLEGTGGGRVHYRATLARPGCKTTAEGTATVAKGHLTAADGATKLAFTDGGVDLTLGKGACAGSTEEFFYDQYGSMLAEPNDEGSGCDLHILNGTMDKERFIHFYYALKRAIAGGDRKTVAGMVHYPFVTFQNKKRLRLKRPADFVAKYSQVVTACVRQAILNQRLSRFFCRDQGVMFGNGEVWVDEPYFKQEGQPDSAKFDPGPKIVAINGGDCSLAHGK